MFQAILSTVVATLLRAEAMPVNSNCKRRHNSELLRHLREHDGHNAIHVSFYSSPNGSIHIRGRTQHSGIQIDGSISGNRGKRGSCDSVSTGPVHERSLCPWHYVINYDADRYPQSLTEARRDTRHCAKCTFVSLNEAECQAVRYKVPVIYKTDRCDTEGYYEYDFVYHKLIVGYACRKVPE